MPPKGKGKTKVGKKKNTVGNDAHPHPDKIMGPLRNHPDDHSPGVRAKLIQQLLAALAHERTTPKHLAAVEACKNGYKFLGAGSHKESMFLLRTYENEQVGSIIGSPLIMGKIEGFTAYDTDLPPVANPGNGR